MNQTDLKLTYLHYAIRNDLGSSIKQFSTVTMDQKVCLNRINEQIQELKKSGQEPDRVLVFNNYTYEILLENTHFVDTTVGKIQVSYELRIDLDESPKAMQYIDIEVISKE